MEIRGLYMAWPVRDSPMEWPDKWRPIYSSMVMKAGTPLRLLDFYSIVKKEEGFLSLLLNVKKVLYSFSPHS
jgi:hypothetical protein